MAVAGLPMFPIPTSQFDARISLVMTALLSILVFHLAQKEAWPSAGYLVSGGKCFMTAYILIFALIVQSVVANWLAVRERQVLAAKLGPGCGCDCSAGDC